jgi:hypothetical protein
MPSCAASTPAHSVSRGACFGLRSPSDGLPCSDRSGASGTHLRMPSVRAYCSCDPGLPGPFRGNGGDGVSSPLHTVLSAQGSNASGFAVVASSAPPASPTLAVLSVGAGAAFVSKMLPLARSPQRPHIRQPRRPPSQPRGQARDLRTLLRLGGLHTNQAASRLQDGVRWHAIWERRLLQARCRVCGCRCIFCSAHVRSQTGSLIAATAVPRARPCACPRSGLLAVPISTWTKHWHLEAPNTE